MHIHINNTCEYYDLHCFCTHAENPETCPQTLLTKHTAIHAYIHIHNTIHMYAHTRPHTYMRMCLCFCSTSSAVIYNSRVILVFISFFSSFYTATNCHRLLFSHSVAEWRIVRITWAKIEIKLLKNQIILRNAYCTHSTHTPAHAHTHIHTKCNGGNCCLWLGIFFCIRFVVWVRVVLPFKNSRSCSADIFL